ncbi:MAG: thiamine pyrophosphate-dependent dehydrogenase E1 component subunit alpha [Ruminococcus sp.]|nr:thiamine pyrophosphate-dependent dehydrogenase E1 component subunit alpha [Ruminococcus sp.]
MDKKQMLGIYEMMNRIRCFEEKAYSLFESNKLRGSVHLCTGEEAIPATVCSYLTDEDYITSTHRGHGDCLAKGAESKYALAELMGKATGYCKGRGGSMHIADLAKGNLGANAIVGGGIPHAVGAALALQMQGKKKNVAISFFGDSASNEGVTHEAMNLAAVWKVPCIFVCANNGFGISVPYAQSTSVKHVSERGAAYGIPSVTVDGNDVMAVAEAFETALKRAQNGEGPTLIECMTYRYRGHWTGDPEPYRSKKETKAWKEEKDPIIRFRKYLLDNKKASAKELDAIEAAMVEELNEAEKFAIESPEPNPADVLDDVFYVEG